MPGKLLIVTGLSGSGKSTLVEAVLAAVPDILYLKTYTTRPQRSGEEHVHEYIFVSEEEYASIRQASSSWDHTEYAGYSYGANISDTLDRIRQGAHVICAVAPSPKIIAQVKSLYAVGSLIILIDTPRQVAESRIANDKIRKIRQESLDDITPDYVFTPTGKITEDSKLFVEYVQKIVKNNVPDV